MKTVTGDPGIAVDVLPDAEEAERVAATGAVASVQEAIVSLPGKALPGLWTAETLERLARAYWRYLERVSRGLFRVVYGDDSRTVVLATRRLPLLRFRAPEYELGEDTAMVTWRLDRGLLVASAGRGQGWLRIEVVRRDAPADAPAQDAEVRIRVEVRNFYPLLRGQGRFARFGAWLYARTQLRIHRRITIGFLRSLAGPLPETAVGL